MRRYNILCNKYMNKRMNSSQYSKYSDVFILNNIVKIGCTMAFGTFIINGLITSTQQYIDMEHKIKCINSDLNKLNERVDKERQYVDKMTRYYDHNIKEIDMILCKIYEVDDRPDLFKKFNIKHVCREVKDQTIRYDMLDLKEQIP